MAAAGSVRCFYGSAAYDRSYPNADAKHCGIPGTCPLAAIAAKPSLSACLFWSCRCVPASRDDGQKMEGGTFEAALEVGQRQRASLWRAQATARRDRAFWRLSWCLSLRGPRRSAAGARTAQGPALALVKFRARPAGALVSLQVVPAGLTADFLPASRRPPISLRSVWPVLAGGP